MQIRVRHVGLAAALALGPALGLAPASAQSDGPAFSCESGLYQVINGQLNVFEPADGAYSPIGDDGPNYNAMGYRIADGYLYARSGARIWRIDAEGNRTDLGKVDMPGGSYTGDFGDDGLLHTSHGGKRWYAIDVDTLEATHIPELESKEKVADVANVHGVFYGVSHHNELIRYDPEALTVTNVGKVPGLPTRSNAYGAAWATAGGNLYVGRNTGEVYQITGYSTDSPKATLVGVGSKANSNDGAACSAAPVGPGLIDVDGAEPETEPKTEEAISATETYVEDFETIAETFIDLDGPDAPAPTEIPEEHPVVEATEETFTVETEAIGTGEACEVNLFLERPPRTEVTDIVVVDAETVLYESGFAENAFPRFQVKNGEWVWETGALRQLHDCGYDLASILTEPNVENFRWEATFASQENENHGGLTFNHSSTDTRSGAAVVDLAEGGTIVRWGEYDELGRYGEIGRAPITPPALGEAVTLAVEVRGSTVAITYNGAAIGSMTTTASAGLVGVFANGKMTDFQQVTLTGLPS